MSLIGQTIVNTYSTPADISKALLNITFTTTTVPTTDQVTDQIIRADAYIDQASGHNWKTQQWVEQHDAIGTGLRSGTIIPRNRPIITVDKLEYWDGTSAWVEGKQGFPSDFPDKQTYYVYLPEGKIVWHKLRLDQRLRYRITYTWGYATVPEFVRDLSSSIAARDILLFWGSQLGLQEDISLFKKRLDEKIFRLEARATQRVATSVG